MKQTEAKQLQAVDKIELNDGTEVSIDVNVTALTLFDLQREKVIDGDFLKQFLKGDANDIGMEPVPMLQAIYAAYRQKNQKDYMSFKDFLANYSLDIEVAIEIYFAVISKEMRKAFQKNFPKTAKSGK